MYLFVFRSVCIDRHTCFVFNTSYIYRFECTVLLLVFFIESLDELKCLKGELKAWESMFERKHGRRPNKVRL